jgi:hypothetical protein
VLKENDAMFYWDKWEAEALSKVDKELAALGRQVMRDHYQHSKEDWLLGEESDGPEMLRICLDDPEAAKERFEEELPN